MTLPVHLTGGMEIHAWELAKGLNRRGLDVTIITGRHPDDIEYEEKDGVRIFYVGKKKASSTYPLSYWDLSSKKFIELNNIKKFDIVHTESIAAWGIVRQNLKKKYKIPLITTLQGTILGEIKSVVSKQLSFRSILIICFYIFDYFTLALRFIRASDIIIAPSNELKDDIEKQYFIPRKKIVMIPNGIDTNKFMPNLIVSDLREKYGLQNKKIILSIGVMTGQKGQNLLLQVFPEILKTNKNVKLVLVGYGPELNNLKNMAKELNISENVVFTGKIPHGDLQFYYNLADVFVFPTLRLEAGPLVIPEAMACEKPVIASRIGGIPTVIENYKDGILIEPGNLIELKDRILEVLSDEELARKLGKNARRKIVSRYSLDRMLEDTIQVYKKVLK